MAFRGVDFFEIDTLFDEQELLVRQTARQWVERALPAAGARLLPRRALPRRTDPRDGRDGLPRRQPGRLRLRRHEQRGVRADHAGTRARRFRPAQLRLRAGRAGHVPDPRLRHRGAEAALAAAPADRRGRRLLRPHRARFRLQPRRHAHHRAARRRLLGAQRREDLDHQRHHRRRGGGLGAHAGGRPRLPGGEGHARLYHLRHPRQVVHARVGHLQPLVLRLPHSARKTSCPAPRA